MTMIKLRCLGSGSSGNCWILENETEALILDAGIKIAEVKKALDFNVSKIVGVCVTHCHKDHSLAIGDFENMGVSVFKPYLGGKQFAQFRNFKVNAFSVPHDNVSCRGFLIQHADIGKFLYMTDLEYCHYTFASHKVQHIICESNYDMQFVDKSRPNYEHILRGHMSLKECCKFAEVNKTDHLQNFIICHLSEFNSHSGYFIEEVKKIVPTSVLVDFADKGKQWELTNGSKCPFL